MLAEKRFDNSGEGMKGKGQLLVAQGKFQGVLMGRLAAFGKEGVDVRIGSRVVGVTQCEGYVRVVVQNAAGEAEEIDACYLVGADGAHSTVRKEVNEELRGETLDAQLVATDLWFDFEKYGFYDANFVVDEKEYGLIGRISKPGEGKRGQTLWRVSYGVPLGMDEETIRETIDERLVPMLPNGGRGLDGKKEYTVQKIAPYKAQQRCVMSFVHGNVVLIGDAAHLTNPYAGLGLASGMADASSLSEVLVRILSGEAKDTKMLLDAWSRDRRKKFGEVVDKPSRMAYKRVRSDVSSEEKVQQLLSRDPMVKALKKGMPVMPPSLETKGEELEGW